METVLPPVEFTPRERGGVKFGGRLKQIRAERNLSLEQAARGIGIYASTLHRLETGNRGAGFAIAQAISAYYAVTVADLQQEAKS